MPSRRPRPGEAPHAWRVSPHEARALQEQLRHRVILEDHLDDKVRRVAGVDVGFEQRTLARAAVAVLELPSLQLLEHSVARMPVEFPYIPGLLSFRELPAVLAAMQDLRQPPDVVLCDGQGYAHPRRFGIACHLGVLMDLPTIGVAKQRLLGTHAPVGEERGAWSPLWDRGERIGAVLRTRPGTHPLYVSPGHRVSLATAIELVLACLSRYRLPETTRHAHRLASAKPA